INYKALSVADRRCWGSVADEQRYLQSRSAKTYTEYRGHIGPVMATDFYLRQRANDAELEKIDGLVSVGFDGALMLWSLLESCKSDLAREKTYWYDEKLLDVMYSDTPLVSVAISPDSEY